MPALRVSIHESTSKIKSSKALSWVIISATIGINSEPMVGGILRQYRAWQASLYLLLIISTAPIFLVLKYLPIELPGYVDKIVAEVDIIL